MTSTAPRLRRPDLVGVWYLTAGVAAVLVSLLGVVIPRLATPTTELGLPFWALVLIAAAAERAMVHLHFRGESHSFSLSETALVFGLFFAAPVEVVLAQVLGGALVRGYSRQAPVKQAFNAAAAGLDAAVALLVFSVLRGDSSVVSPEGWLGAVTACAVSGVVGAVLVTLAMSLAGGQGPALSQLREIMLPSIMINTTNASVAVAAAVLLTVDPRTALVLAVPGVMLFTGYRSYLRQRQEAERVDFLLECSQLLSADAGGPAPTTRLLQHIRDRFLADSAELVLFDPDHRDRATRITVRPNGTEQGPLAAVAAAALRDYVDLTAAEPVARPASHPVLAALRDGTGDGLSVALPGLRRPVGLLLLNERTSRVNRSDRQDPGLLEALAQQMAAALENDQLRGLQEQLQHQASHDALTGLPNRRLFLERLEAALPSRPALLFLDLDGFKAVNDTHGHAVGDFLLQRLAERFTSCLSEDAVAARLGGDEFAVLIPGPTTAGKARAVSEGLLVGMSVPVSVAGLSLAVRASIGVAQPVRPTDSAADLMRAADIAMYAAKSRGKGQVVTFEPSQETAVLLRAKLEQDIEDAVRAHQLDLALQPIICLLTERLVGLEALVRWQHPVRGVVNPETFIPVAEQTGLITELGRQIIRTAYELQAGWAEAGPADSPYVSVNLSAGQLDHPGLVAELMTALTDAGVMPDKVMLEITETALLRDQGQGVAKLAALRAAGMRIALDDFGTGYSSLHLLRSLPVDVVKLDRSFIAGLVDSKADQAVVRAVVTLADALGLQVIAEGVETAAQAELLRLLGCQYAQGFHFSRPLSPAAANALVLQARELESVPRARWWANDEDRPVVTTSGG